jgi:hypothetical protein
VAVGQQIRYIHRTIDGSDVYFVASATGQARKYLCTFRVQGKRPELWWPDTGRVEPVTVYNEQGGRTLIPLRLDPNGSVFVIFRGEASPPPDRVVSVRRNGIEISGIPPTPAPEIQLQHEFSPLDVGQGEGGQFQALVWQPGAYELKTAGGRTFTLEVADLPSPIEIGGPWELKFPKGWGAPEHVTLERLASWTDHPDPGVKYFSGTATYRRQIDVPVGMLGKDRPLYLDLGRVQVIAEVKLNGRDLGILWKPPFRVEITDAARAGANDLEVKVVNLWPNRLIGDAQLAEDSEWTPQFWGEVLRRWPQWLLENKPSPTGRLTFTSWKHWTKNDPLLESGLLGPVKLVPAERRAF